MSETTVATHPRTRKNYKFTIEVGDDKGRNPLFGPAHQQLRGRWSRELMIGTISGKQALSKMPDVPGLYIEVNTEKKAARIYDPLAEPKNKKLLDTVTPLFKEIVGEDGRPWEPIIRTSMTETELKTWTYYCWRMVNDNNPCARLIDGELPETIEDVLELPGQTRIEHFNTVNRQRRTLEGAKEAEEKEGYFR